MRGGILFFYRHTKFYRHTIYFFCVTHFARQKKRVCQGKKEIKNENYGNATLINELLSFLLE